MLHIQTVEPFTLGLLNRLMDDPYLQPFVLVGGTALALQIGHRKSIDLDLFTHEDFEASALLEHLLAKGYSLQVIHNQKQTLIVEIQGVKVDFIRFRYSFAQEIIDRNGIRMADIKDISCMKIDAIAGRGKKKDFCDLYYLLQYFTLIEMMDAYNKMYRHSTLFHIYKSLTWFEDADLEGDLEMYDKDFNWEKAKKAIVQAVGNSI